MLILLFFGLHILMPWKQSPVHPSLHYLFPYRVCWEPSPVSSVLVLTYCNLAYRCFTQESDPLNSGNGKQVYQGELSTKLETVQERRTERGEEQTDYEMQIETTIRQVCNIFSMFMPNWGRGQWGRGAVLGSELEWIIMSLLCSWESLLCT